MLRASSHLTASPNPRTHALPPPLTTRRAAPSAAARRPRVYATPATRTRLSEQADAPRGIVGKIKTVWHIFFPPEASAASAAKTRMSRALFSDRHGRRGERLDVQALADEVKGVVTEYVDLADARPEAMQFDTLLDKRQGKLKHYFLVARAKPKYQAILGGTTTAEEQAEWEARAATESLRGLEAQPRGYTTGVEADRAAIARARRRRGGAL